MIGTTAAIIGSAIIGAGATALASNNAANAAKSAANAQEQASAASLAENQRQFDTIQANNAPYRQVGNASIGALGAAFGLPGYGAAAPTMTSGTPSYGSTPVPGAGGISMTGATAAPSYASYLAANPDLAAEAQRVTADGEFPSTQAYLAWHDQRYANEGRPSTPDAAPPPASQNPVSMTGATPATTSGGYTPQAGYSDPTTPNGYYAGERPTPAATPAGYTPGTLDVSLGAFQKSPDYNFRLQEGNNALDHVASSMGGVMSGARVKAADRYNQDYATTNYDDWRNFTTSRFDTANNLGNTLAQERIGQSNADRARSDGLYQDDRSFLTGQYNNRTGQLMTLAGFGQNANASNANAASSFASSDAALRGTAATAQGNAAIGGANAFTSGVNNLMTTGSYLAGQYMSNPSSYYNVNPSSGYAGQFQYGSNTPTSFDTGGIFG